MSTVRKYGNVDGGMGVSTIPERGRTFCFFDLAREEKHITLVARPANRGQVRLEGDNQKKFKLLSAPVEPDPSVTNHVISTADSVVNVQPAEKQSISRSKENTHPQSNTQKGYHESDRENRAPVNISTPLQAWKSSNASATHANPSTPTPSTPSTPLSRSHINETTTKDEKKKENLVKRETAASPAMKRRNKRRVESSDESDSGSSDEVPSTAEKSQNLVKPVAAPSTTSTEDPAAKDYKWHKIQQHLSETIAGKSESIMLPPKKSEHIMERNAQRHAVVEKAETVESSPANHLKDSPRILEPLTNPFSTGAHSNRDVANSNHKETPPRDNLHGNTRDSPSISQLRDNLSAAKENMAHREAARLRDKSPNRTKENISPAPSNHNPQRDRDVHRETHRDNPPSREVSREPHTTSSRDIVRDSSATPSKDTHRDSLSRDLQRDNSISREASRENLKEASSSHNRDNIFGNPTREQKEREAREKERDRMDYFSRDLQRDTHSGHRESHARERHGSSDHHSEEKSRKRSKSPRAESGNSESKSKSEKREYKSDGKSDSHTNWMHHYHELCKLRQSDGVFKLKSSTFMYRWFHNQNYNARIGKLSKERVQLLRDIGVNFEKVRPKKNKGNSHPKNGSESGSEASESSDEDNSGDDSSSEGFSSSSSSSSSSSDDSSSEDEPTRAALPPSVDKKKREDKRGERREERREDKRGERREEKRDDKRDDKREEKREEKISDDEIRDEEEEGKPSPMKMKKGKERNEEEAIYNVERQVKSLGRDVAELRKELSKKNRIVEEYGEKIAKLERQLDMMKSRQKKRSGGASLMMEGDKR
ncbi:hypothetical protein PROFUN_02324 [Planoprotostelium fungivorum]|uniref:Uncharacterized protein n=1 Tax=Planoprotostelium fungivorum TaxID=1890364 RepID=A0A2P6NYL3_9EUKA|nr:hypothetical protein PROFUN_02324 [Planoprotostelium fungivorum]